VLKRVFVKINVVVIIVRVRKKLVLNGKHIRGRYVQFGKKQLLGSAHVHDLVALVAQVLTLLVTQVAVYVPIADDLERSLHPYGAVVGCHHYLHILFGDLAHDVYKRRVQEPALRNRTISVYVLASVSLPPE